MTDQSELASVAHRYAQAVDRGDRAAFTQLFTDDAVVSVFNPSDAAEPGLSCRAADEFEKLMEPLRGFTRTFHFIGNMVFDVDGERATGEVYCLAHHFRRGGLGGTDYVMYIRYQDQYLRRSDGWKISGRRVLVDWTEYRTTNRLGQ